MTERSNTFEPMSLADRVKRYQKETETIVAAGAEHPQYEFKRSISIEKVQLADRLDFVKLIQGIANTHSAEERYIVIGADQREKKIGAVQNAGEFDPAKLEQILSKYLSPTPVFEVFNSLQTSVGETFVLIVISPSQPRPICVVTEGQSDQRTHGPLSGDSQ